MATPIFGCGFECGVGPGHWTAVVGSPSFQSSIKRSGSLALQLNTTAATARLAVTVGSGTIGIFSGYFQLVSLPGADVQPISKPLQTAGASDIELSFIAATSKVTLGAGANVQSSANALNAGQWYRLDIRANVAANPWLVDWQIDGVAQTQVSMPVAATTIVGCALGWNASQTANMVWDDVLLSSTSGDYPLAVGKVLGFVPTADGTHNTGGGSNFTNAGGTAITDATTTAFQNLDEIPMVLTDRVEQRLDTTGNRYVEVGMDASNAANPISVEAFGIIAGATATTCAGGIKLRDNLGSTDDTIFAGNVASATALWKRKHYAARPAALGAWTNAALADLRFRVGFGTDVTPDVYFGGVMVEVAFEGALSVTPGLLAAAAAPIEPTRIDQQVTPGLLSAAIAAIAPSIPQIVAPAVQSRPVTPTAFTRIDQAANPAVLSGAVAPLAPRVDQQVVAGLQSRPVSPIAPSVVYLVNPAALSAPAAPVAPSRIDQQVSVTVITAPISDPAATINQEGGTQQVTPALISAPAVAVALARVDQQVLAVLVGAAATAIAPVINQAGVQNVTPALVSAPAAPVAFVRVDQQLSPGLVSRPVSAAAPARVDQQVTAVLIGAAAAVVAPGRIDQQVEVTLLTEALSVLSPEIQHGLGISIGGTPPAIVGVHTVPGGQAILLLPAGTAGSPTPTGGADNPKPGS